MDALSVIPPVVAIILAFATKRVLLSLFVALVTAEFIVADFSLIDGLSGSMNLFVSLFKEEWIIYSLLFVILVGPIIRLLKDSNAVYSFVDLLTKRHHVVNSRRSTLFAGLLTGVFIFIESTLTTLIVATISKPFAYRYKISREKIAYLCDTTSAPICSMIPINGWGALLIGLLTSVITTMQLSDTTAVELLFYSVLFNFYGAVSLLVLAFFIYKDVDIGPMKTTFTPYEAEHDNRELDHRFIDFLMPIVSLLVILFASLFITGNGDMMKGDGSRSLFIAVVLTTFLMYIQYVFFGKMQDSEFMESVWKGVFELAPIGVIMMFAFTFSAALTELQTAKFLGTLVSGNLPVYLIPALVFLLSAVIAFATGTSWGTFAIMIPIAVSTIDPAVLTPAVVIGAVISGGVFGDHTSPISDTTILSSLAAESNHINHVKTQLPYALISAFIALVLYIVVTILLIT